MAASDGSRYFPWWARAWSAFSSVRRQPRSITLLRWLIPKVAWRLLPLRRLYARAKCLGAGGSRAIGARAPWDARPGPHPQRPLLQNRELQVIRWNEQAAFRDALRRRPAKL